MQIVLISGLSGSGKSSLVKAGLLPNLRDKKGAAIHSISANEFASFKALQEANRSTYFKYLTTQGFSRYLATDFLPGWLEMDAPNFKGVVKALPQREDISDAITEQLIVELYSK